MCILARHGAEYAEGRRHGITTALDGQLHDVLGIEVGGIRRKRCARRVLDSLVDRQDGDIPRSGKAAMVRKRLQAAQHARRPIRRRPDPIDEVRARQVKRGLRNRPAFMPEEADGLVPENRFDAGDFCRRAHGVLRALAQYQNMLAPGI